MPVSGPAWRAGPLFPLTGYTELRDLGGICRDPFRKEDLSWGKQRACCILSCKHPGRDCFVRHFGELVTRQPARGG